MTPTELLADGFSRIPGILAGALGGLEMERLTSRPTPGANPLAWLAWHIARGQDTWIADLDGSPQLWTSDGWYERFALPFGPDEIGFGMSADDAARVVAAPELLAAYVDAVTARTLAYLSTLAEQGLDEIVDGTRRPAVTRGVQLMSILDDNLQHAGQAGYARGILDRSLPRNRTPRQASKLSATNAGD